MAHPIGNLYGKIPVVGHRVSKSPSYNEILPRLYLGDIGTATNKQEIGRLGITDMISVEIKPLNQSDISSTVKNYLFINVMDHSKQDIMSHFDSSNEFIESALKVPSNKVYVHCVAGISRSASLVIAYIMKTRSMNYSEAFDLVSSKRRVIDPNEGFVKQLNLYHRMNYKLDISNIEYRRIVLDALVFDFRLISLSYYQVSSSKTSNAAGSGSNSSGLTMIQMPILGIKNINRNSVSVLFDQYYTKLHLQQVSKFPQVYDPHTAFKCNKCRAIVFYAISVIENKISSTLELSASTSASSSRSPFDLTSKLTSRDNQKNRDCPFIFIEPQPWMSKDVLEREGNLLCYKCNRKLGKFDWTSGESCSCARHNSHLNFNLFKIMKKKIDFKPDYRLS